MLHFFRKIRHDLIVNSQTYKYLKYAIGEIVLVVLGILIALQINRWDEKRIDREIEYKLLLEVKANLESATSVLDISSSFDERCIRSSLIIINSLSEDAPYNDSLKMHFAILPNLVFGGLTSSGFQTLKMKGLDLIKNDSIRINLSNLYENKIPQLIRTLELDVYKRRDELFNSELYNHFMLQHSIFGESAFGRVPNDYEGLKNDKRFESILRSYTLNKVYFNSEKMKIKNDIINLINDIKIEIESRS